LINILKMDYEKYSVLQVDCNVSSKYSESSKKPTKSYYEISFFAPDSGFNYIMFQNLGYYILIIKKIY
jgi:hypothetical protein